MRANTPPVFFPLHAVHIGAQGERSCGCGAPACDDVGVHPAVRYRDLTASVESASGRYGMRTGDGLAVVDVDRKNGKDGLGPWQALCESQGCPVTRTIQTPSGGLHFYFSLPPGVEVANSQSRIGLGIDVRGSGGYVVAEGTTGRDGVTPYRVVQDVPIAEMPKWLIGMLHTARPLATPGDATVTLSDAERARRCRLFYTDACTFQPSISGQGGDTALWAIALRGVRHYALPPIDALNVIRAGFNPRCQPPWDEERLRYKVAQAELATDVPLNACEPEGFAARMAEGLLLAAHPTRETAPSLERRIKDPKHKYTVDPKLLDYSGRTRGASLLEVVSILSRHPTWAGVFQWDEFQLRVTPINPPMPLEGESLGLTRADIGAVRCWLVSHGINVSQEIASDAIDIVAKAQRYDSAQDWLASVQEPKSDGEARLLLRELAIRGFGTSGGDGAISFVLRHMIGSVKRIQIPGYQHDHCCVLSGVKGLRKTSALRSIAPPEFVRAQMPALDGRDGSHATGGFLHCIFDEMGYVFRHDRESLKTYITRTEDAYRQFGNGDKVRALRRCVFWGTTNPDPDLIKDCELDRRWLILHCIKRCDPDWILCNQAAIWGAAKRLAKVEQSYLSDDEIDTHLAEAQADHRSSDSWDEAITAWLGAKYPGGKAHGKGQEFLSEIFVGVFGEFEPLKTLRGFTIRDRDRVRSTLDRLGWHSGSVRDGAKVSRGWARRAPKVRPGGVSA